jgi:hypothetical protein
MKNLTKTRAALYLAAVFLAGLVAGAAAGYAWWRHPPFRPPPPTAFIAQEISRRYQGELGLSAEQLERFRPIALEAATNMTQLHSDVMQRVGEQFRHTHEQMATWLTAEQAGKLRAFEERERRKFAGAPAVQ